MVSANEAQLAAKASAAAARKAEEDAFSRKLLERFAEEDRLEQMNAQRRRMKVRGKGWWCVWCRWRGWWALLSGSGVV
jgi:hypothetical protein